MLPLCAYPFRSNSLGVCVFGPDAGLGETVVSRDRATLRSLDSYELEPLWDGSETIPAFAASDRDTIRS